MERGHPAHAASRFAVAEGEAGCAPATPGSSAPTTTPTAHRASRRHSSPPAPIPRQTGFGDKRPPRVLGGLLCLLFTTQSSPRHPIEYSPSPGYTRLSGDRQCPPQPKRSPPPLVATDQQRRIPSASRAARI